MDVLVGRAVNPATANYDAPARAVLSILLILTTFCLAARIAARYLRNAKTGADDVLAYLAYLINTGQLICGFIAVQLGYTNAAVAKRATPSDVTFLTRNMTALGLLYLMVIIPMKLSILFLHRRIFTLNQKWVRYYWWFNFLLIFPCWTTITFTLFGLIFNPLGAPKRLTTLATPLVGSVNAASDFMVLLLPIICVSSLQMARRTKIQLCALFSLGLLASVLSILRVVLIERQIASPHNDVFHEHLVNISTTVSETSVGFMCVCLPIVKPVFQKMDEYCKRSYSDVSSSVVTLRQWMYSKRTVQTDSASQLEDGSTTRLHGNQINRTDEYKVDSVQMEEVSAERADWQGRLARSTVGKPGEPSSRFN